MGLVKQSSRLVGKNSIFAIRTSADDIAKNSLDWNTQEFRWLVERGSP